MMKKPLLIALALLICSSMFSQIEFSKEKFNSALDGYVIKPDNKKIEGRISYEHPVNLSKEVLFNGKIYKPGELKEFFVNEIKWISVMDKKDEKFAPVLKDGPITTYWIMSYPEGTEYPDNNSPWEKMEYMKMLDGEPVATTSLLLGFKNKMSEFVIDYPELSEKIANKEKGYGSFNYLAVIDEYNAWYIEQHPEFLAVAEVVEVSLPESSIVLPEGLYGKWHYDEYTFTIGKNSIKFDYDMGGGNTVNTEYLIEEYLEEYGFVCGSMVSYMSFGFDAMESFQDHVGFIYFTELTENTVIIYFQGHGVIGNENKYDLHSSPDEFKYLGREYTRVE